MLRLHQNPVTSKMARFGKIPNFYLLIIVAKCSILNVYQATLYASEMQSLFCKKATKILYTYYILTKLQVTKSS